MTPPTSGFTSLHHLGIFWGFLDRHHRHGRAVVQRPDRPRSFAFLPIVDLSAARVVDRRLQLDRAHRDRLWLFPPPRRQAAAHPDVARRRHHLVGDRRPHDDALRVSRLRHGVGGTARVVGPVSSVVAGWFSGDERRIRAHAVEVHVVDAHQLGLAFSTTCPTRSTSTSSARCPTSSSATSISAAPCPSSTSRTRTIGASARSSSSSQKSLMDQYACTECARCSNFCPAFNTDKPLSPMHLIHDCATR